MLHSNFLPSDRARALLEGGLAQDQAEGGGIGDLVSYLFGFLKRQYAVILFTTALALSASVIYLKTTPPTYTGKVKVLFGNPKTQFVQQQSIVAEAPIDMTQIETQLEILRSKTIALAVINQLKLAEDPTFKSSERSFRSLWQRIRGVPAPQQPPQDTDQAASEDALVNAFRERLSANRVGASNVIEISFNANSAQRAAEIANAVANAYISDQLNSKFEANRTATTWLQDRLRELGQQAQTAERAVNVYKSENNIVVTGGKPIDDQLVTDLNSRLVAARAQTADNLARLNRFESILRSNSADSASIGNLDASGSDALSNPIINNLRQQYLEYSRRETEWSARFGRDHLAVVNLRTRMRDIRTSILDEVRRLAETSRSDYEVAKQRQESVEKQLAQAVSQSRTTNSAELTLRELETRAKSYRSLYDSFLQRYMGSIQQESFPISEARILSPASPPLNKTKPKGLLVLALGLFGGIAIGGGLGLLRDIMDRVFRTTSQVESILHLPCLSLVPRVKDIAVPKGPPARVASHDQTFNPRAIHRKAGIFWAATTMPLSRFAESIRSIKLAIDLNPTKTSNKIVGITSSLPNEGKSTLSASLAQLIGHAGKRVIIVDCDLKNPSLSAELAPTATAGLIEVISGARTLEETIWKDQKTNLEFLPAVKRTPLFHTSEILSSEQTRKLFDKLRTMYDYVIVDLPPLAPVVDVRATTPLIDCFILVVEWGRTKIDVVQHALHTAPNVYETLIGTVLNKTDMKAMKRYDGYHNDYYHNEYYTRYGYAD
ncbi:MAG: protein tyrosine kinase [Rhizobiales bacterium 62-47]|nr:polysaccharide biosynthesis tyrosine autokinase [Hyphomicrobiales bacterium]OJY11959.1 MAG: protein tyrosine kinase [Rhizobiales bacterium 62-47]